MFKSIKIEKEVEITIDDVIDFSAESNEIAEKVIMKIDEEICDYEFTVGLIEKLIESLNQDSTHIGKIYKLKLKKVKEQDEIF